MTKRKNKVILALSGGIDSSVAALLLKEAGEYEVVTAFMELTDFSFEAEDRARRVAEILDVPFCIFDFKKKFQKKVIKPFLKDNQKGLTPNPCVLCNQEIKFGLFLTQALKLGADYIATGHYIKKEGERLFKGKDKDQSYFLWGLTQKQLKRLLFPLADYTREEVERIAQKFKLPFFGVKKSTEICFIPQEIQEFLKENIKGKEGKIVTLDGEVLGHHQGLWLYTIGQRKGIGLAGGPYYVLGKDIKKNLLIVTKKEKDLLKKELTFSKVNWLSGREPSFPLKVEVKIRYYQKAVSAIIRKEAGSYSLEFLKPVRAVASGQSVVFYQGEELLGGGIII